MFKLLAILLLCACATIGMDHPTLLIANRGFERFRVTDEYGFTLARVYPGDSVCVKLTRDAPQRLIFLQPYKGREFTPRFNPATHPGWRIEINNVLVHGVLSLGPAKAC